MTQDTDESLSRKISLLERNLPVLVFAAPILVVLAGNLVLNETIEYQAVSYGFFVDAPLQPAAMHNIPAKVIEALYGTGFALCATFVLAVMLTLYASVIVWRALGRTGWAPTLRLGYILALLAVLAISAFRMPGICDGLWPQLDRKNLPTQIAYELIEHTISDLPICRKGATKGSVVCEKEKAGEKPAAGQADTFCPKEPDDSDFSIGNTGHSLGRVAVLAYGLIAVAGLGYVAAVTALAASPLPVPPPAPKAGPGDEPGGPVAPEQTDNAEPDANFVPPPPPVPVESGVAPPDLTQAVSEADQAQSRLDGLSMLAAVTFVVTIVAVGLLFQPGYEMILHAHNHGKAPDDILALEKLPLLQDYNALGNALRTSWATLFSLALATAHFGAKACLKVRDRKEFDFAGVGPTAKALLMVLSPTLADIALQIGGGLAGLAP